MSEINPYTAPSSTTFNAPEALVPKNTTELASRWKRFAGSVIDTLFLVIVLVPLAIGFFTIFPELADENPQLGNAFVVELVETAVVFAVMFAIFALFNYFLLASRGQTIGKYLLGTQILSDRDELVPATKILFVRYFLIWFLGALPFVGRLFNLANAVAIFAEDRKCLHDRICGTKVVMYSAPVKADVPEPLFGSDME